ncbi:MAG: DUF502 domain-containing protein [Phycisphaerae bacterium]|nr:DUF502 domain-containing protein [Gemmatimonadaceae bacterium]
MRVAMGRLIGYFVRGLVLLVPIAVTAYVCWWIFVTLDGWLAGVLTQLAGRPVPGAGFIINIVLITLVGFLGSTIITKSFFVLFERTLARLPLVRLLYSATKDLLNAFVGEKRRFDQPVSIRLFPGNDIQMFGFVTQESLSHLGLEGVVSVYCPHSYAWAGQMMVVPTNQIQKLHHASSDVMAFIVSGGVTGFPAATPNATITPRSAADIKT